MPYLTKVGATYYFRRPVPDDLRGHFLTDSGLGIKDQNEAKRLRNECVTRIDREIEDARARLNGSTTPVPAVSVRGVGTD